MSSTRRSRRRPRTLAALALSVAIALLAACGSPGTADSGAASETTAGGKTAASGTLTVFAAASLNTSFTQLGGEFEQQHPGVDVTLNFGGSSDLVAQLTAGAPGDVYASANEATMDKAVEAGIVAGTPTPFATNTLTIVTAPGNPKHITDLAGLAAASTAGVNVVVCAPPVPCGAATQKVEEDAGVQLRPVSEEQSVTDVLGKVTSGQADAGLVYVTDAKGAGGRVEVVDFPEAKAAVNSYPIAALASARQPATAQRFVEFVAGPRGQEVLAAAGFSAP